ncbi:MAG: hypothetical protein IIX18_02555 [Clostridia bacterium]|nr:hypothetical protein [Clostridia bacterium]
MKTAKLVFSSEQEIKKYIEECENGYKNGVARAFEATLGSKIITLCGPSCSGKTTTSKILDKEYAKIGKTLHAISIDDFYIDRDVLDARCRKEGIPLDYDSPRTIDFELFERVMEQIEKGETVTVPRFDFTVGRRVGYTDIACTDGDIFLFEGIQAVYPECTEHLANHRYTPLFISVEEDIEYGNVSFNKRDLRFLRRLVRDSRTRNTDAEKSFSLWRGVVKNEVTNIYPNLTDREENIDSSMPYEVSVIKPFAIPLLESIREDSEYSEKAQKFLKMLSAVPEIDANYVPDDSVFREFIGERK